MRCNDEWGARLKPKLTAIALAALYGVAPTAHAGALPDGGHFVAGSGSIAGSSGALTINQTSARGVIDWNGFSIGSGNRVTFDNGNGATLNRVTGGNTSTILGKLTATGSLYLINPQGVVVGSSGVITTGGRFVASTLDTDNDSFMNGGPLTLSGSSTRRVVNLGKIGSTNGDVFLISADEVDNTGSISAPNGTAEIGAGKKVLLQDSSMGQQVFVETGSHGVIRNAGPVSAAQVNLQAADGNIFALAGDHTTIRATGTAQRNGHVWLVADSGAATLGGTIAARNEDGAGGTVDTDAAQLQVGSAGITPLVEAGQWNLSSRQFTVDGSAAASVDRSLNAGTSVDLETTGGAGAAGDIDVASNLNWNGNASLTLGAYRSVAVDYGVLVSNKGGGSLTLRADTTGIDNSGGVRNNGVIDWSASTGIASLLFDMNGGYNPGDLIANAGWTSPLYSGLVTQITGYQLVNSISDLQNIQNFLPGAYALGRDIDASGAAFNTLAASGTAFTGQFDGMWHTISHLSPSFNGVFGTIAAGAVVRDVNVNASTGVASTSGGILVNNNYGTIVNAFTSGTIVDPYSDDGATLGGLVGTNYGLIARSGSSAAVQADSGAAGLVADNEGTITQSYATGSVTGLSTHGAAGGLVVSNGPGATITQSFASGYVETPSSFHGWGGICGGCTGLGSDVYWSPELQGQTTSGDPNLPAANALTAVQMQNPASFVGWDFSANGVWAMPVGATHPVLAWQVSHP